MRIFALLFVCQLLLLSKDTDTLAIVNMHDPFAKPQLGVKPTKAQKPKPIFKLHGIFEDSALINDTWIAVGMTIDSYTLKSIDDNEAVLLGDSDTVVLKLYKDWNFQ